MPGFVCACVCVEMNDTLCLMLNFNHQFHKSTFVVCKNSGNKADSDSDVIVCLCFAGQSLIKSTGNGRIFARLRVFWTYFCSTIQQTADRGAVRTTVPPKKHTSLFHRGYTTRWRSCDWLCSQRWNLDWSQRCTKQCWQSVIAKYFFCPSNKYNTIHTHLFCTYCLPSFRRAVFGAGVLKSRMNKQTFIKPPISPRGG